MSDMQSMVDKMRSCADCQSTEEERQAEEMIDMLMAAVESGKITLDQAKEIIRNAPDTMEEMSATAGGVAPGQGATFTPGTGMAYAQGLDKPRKKKFKEAFEHDPKAKMHTGDGVQIEKGDTVYHGGKKPNEKFTVEKAYIDHGKNVVLARNADGFVRDAPGRFKSKPSVQSEAKDKEPKLASGKLKKNYAVDKFGFTPAPSIPNRPSTGGFQYKALWDETEELQESYSTFKRQARERDLEGQYHSGIGIVRKKLAEVERMMEYVTRLKDDLVTAGMLNEKTHTKRSLEKMTETIKNIYAQHKKLK